VLLNRDLGILDDHVCRPGRSPHPRLRPAHFCHCDAVFNS
jgi:hypothetical protein